MPSHARAVIAVLVALASSSVPATASPNTAQSPQSSQLPVLKQLSIEELLELDVTLPLRRDERIMDAAAAVMVVTNEDLRRQGAVSLPEALLHVPTLYVGRFTSSSWIVASRGFASTSSNKMLVMIDGRSVYSPLFSGVFWNQYDAILADLDRIEIIRGPGGALWGSNAVNGVINVVSKRAADTQGWLVTIGGGTEEQFYTGGRYGGRLGNGHYRVYGKFFERDAANLANNVDAQDGQRLGTGGVRIDLGSTANGFTVQGDVFRTRSDTTTDADITASGANALARWTYRRSARSQLQLQAYLDRTNRVVPNQIDEERNTFDLDMQHRFSVTSAHTLSSGASYRYSGDDTVASPLLAFDPAARGTNLVAAFIQDEFMVSPVVTLIGGIKVEHNDYTGVEWQPSGRVRWLPNTSQTLWGAVSRAVRMPTRFDTDVRVFQNGRQIASGNPDFKSESVVAYEIGYRARVNQHVAIGVNAFHNRYDDLRSQELTAGGVLVDNKLNDRSTGGSIAATVQPRPFLRLTTAYTHLTHDTSLDPGSTDVYGGRFETIDPEHMFDLNARIDLPRNLELDVMARYVSDLPQVAPQIPGTPDYTEASVRVGWRITPRIEAAVIGRDLLHDDHVEFISPTSSRITRLERAIFTRFTFAF